MNSIRKVVRVSPKFFVVVRSLQRGLHGEMRIVTDAAGTIHAGGEFITNEEEYLCKLRAMQLQQLKERKIEEERLWLKAVENHREAVQRHMDAIKSIKI